MIKNIFIFFLLIVIYSLTIYIYTLPKKSDDNYRVYIKNKRFLSKEKVNFRKAYILNFFFFMDYFF